MAKGFKAALDPDEAPLELVLSADGKSGYAMLAPLKKTTSQREPQWASNVDTEGELSAGSKDKNIEIAPKLRIYGRDEDDFRAVQLALEQKLNKMTDEGGTFRLYYPDGSWIDYEVRAVSGGERLFDNRFAANCRTEDEVTFVCAPFGKGQEYLAGEFKGSERLLEGLIEDVPGTAPALARAEIVSPGADVWELLWGRESRNFTGAATAKALYSAKEMTPIGGAKVGTRTIEGKAGISVVKQTLSPNWSGQLLTDLGGEHLTHVGVFEMLAWISMPAANNGEVGIGLDYGAGDLSIRTTLTPVLFPANHGREGKVVRVSLGQVFLSGASLWQGQINTRSSNAGDELDILAVAFRPLSEGNGRIAATPTLDQPSSLLVRDEFNQTAGSLNGKVMAAAQGISGPNNPGAVVDDASLGGVAAWTNPEGAKSPGGSVASVILPWTQTASSHALKATGFPFALPSTATVEGLLFEVSARAVEPAAPNIATCYGVKAGSATGTSRTANIPFGNFAYLSFGGPTDLMGGSYLYSDINASGFGADILVTSGFSQKIEVDHVRATVYWTDSAGQKWVTSGAPTDIVVETAGHTAQRSVNNDASWSEGRWAAAGTITATDVVVGISAKHTVVAGVAEVVQAVAGRYVDPNNFLFFCFLSNPAGGMAVLNKKVGGAVASLASITIPETTEWHTIRLQIDRRGRYFCWLSYVESGVVRLLAQGQDSDLATGGALASGKVAWEDACVSEEVGEGITTRNYDQFVVWIPPLNAMIYEGLGLRLRSDSVERQGPDGTWSPITPEGDYLKLAPAGLEGRKNRLVLIASPHDPNTMPVGFPTELKVQVWVTPRYRGVPDVA
jgi:hypothetical protein